jgi:hypothetical protein
LEKGSIPIFSADSVSPLQTLKLNSGVKGHHICVDTVLTEAADHQILVIFHQQVKVKADFQGEREVARDPITNQQRPQHGLILSMQPWKTTQAVLSRLNLLHAQQAPDDRDNEAFPETELQDEALWKWCPSIQSPSILANVPSSDT